VTCLKNHCHVSVTRLVNGDVIECYLEYFANEWFYKTAFKNTHCALSRCESREIFYYRANAGLEAVSLKSLFLQQRLLIICVCSNCLLTECLTRMQVAVSAVTRLCREYSIIATTDVCRILQYYNYMQQYYKQMMVNIIKKWWR
jgi:hypothetical protein